MPLFKTSFVSRLEAIALRLEDIALMLEAMPLPKTSFWGVLVRNGVSQNRRKGEPTTLLVYGRSGACLLPPNHATHPAKAWSLTLSMCPTAVNVSSSLPWAADASY